MRKKLLVRAALVAILLSLWFAAGWIGGMTFAPDVEVIRRFQAIRAAAPQMTLAAIALTQAGSAYVTLSSGFGTAAWLVWRGERWRGGVLAASVASERLVIDGLKLVIDRARPALDAHPVATHSSSFPSGHAGNSMAVFLSIALIAAPPAYRRRAVIVALLASLLIGLTRPFLGVHWPSDLVGGWSIGAAIAIIAATIAQARSSGAVEQQH